MTTFRRKTIVKGPHAKHSVSRASPKKGKTVFKQCNRNVRRQAAVARSLHRTQQEASGCEDGLRERIDQLEEELRARPAQAFEPEDSGSESGSDPVGPLEFADVESDVDDSADDPASEAEQDNDDPDPGSESDDDDDYDAKARKLDRDFPKNLGRFFHRARPKVLKWITRDVPDCRIAPMYLLCIVAFITALCMYHGFTKLITIVIVCLTLSVGFFIEYALLYVWTHDVLVHWYCTRMAKPATVSTVLRDGWLAPVFRPRFVDAFLWVCWFVDNYCRYVSGDPSGVRKFACLVSTRKTSLTACDPRMFNQLSVDAVDSRVQLDVYAVIDLTTGDCSHFISCAEMVEETACKIALLEREDREHQAAVVCSRITNMYLRGDQFRATCCGSAFLANWIVNNEEAKSGVTCTPSSRPAVSSTVTQCCVALLLCVFAFSYRPAAMTTYTWFDMVIVAPVVEELLKWLISRATGKTRQSVSYWYGMAEFVVRGCTLDAVPAMWLHVFVGFLPMWLAVLVHGGFNFWVSVGLFDSWFLRYAKYWDFGELRSELTGYDAGVLLEWCKIALETCCSTLRCTQFFMHACENAYPYFVANMYYSCPGLFTQTASAPNWVKLTSIAVFLAASAVQLYGYRIEEVSLPSIPDHSAKIKRLPTFGVACPRRSLCSSLGFIINGTAPCVPDVNHGPTMLHGCLSRFCKNPPSIRPGLLRKLRRFVRKFVRRNYIPLAPDCDYTLETWLAGTNYTDGRKDELRRAFKELSALNARDKRCSGFGKREGYMDFKPSRGINSRDDAFKCATGPFFKLMESQVYHQPCYDGSGLSSAREDYYPFVKHIPVHLRPEFMMQFFAGEAGPFYETDYSQFEKHFTPEVLMAVEMELYRHMLKNFPAVYKLIEETMCGVNVCTYNHFILRIPGRRMSGEMCTSLGNGFSNLMLLKFAAHLRGGSARGIVEGDDALFVSTVKLTVSDFEDLGFNIKINCHKELLSSSFCGLLMTRSRQIMRDPVKVLTKFGWSFSPHRNSSPLVRLSLLRAQALSLAYECPRCPVLKTLAARVLTVTTGVKARFSNDYWGQQLRAWTEEFSARTVEVMSQVPTYDDRVDFYLQFGLTPRTQLRLEQIIGQWNGDPLDDRLISHCLARTDCSRSFYEYSCRSDAAMGFAAAF